ncbi:MAG: hypothetical protein OTI34_02620, partial [Lewinella sp.]|nr:hypothetical protein [Lewinella sp.]
SETTQIDQLGEIPQGPGPTVLGQKLSNPYSVENMRKAAEIIGELSPIEKALITTTHHYIKAYPNSGEDFVALMDFAEAHDLNFELQPHDYEVLYNGDDGYVAPSVPEGTIPPVYGAVSLGLLAGSDFPNVNYDLEEELYIDKNGYATPLTYAAFTISGNEIDYEAIDGFCHPDCPNWPACLDAPELTCAPDVAVTELSTLNAVPYGEVPTNFPDYILDSKMGKNGEFSISTCDEITNQRPACNDGCYPVLEPIFGEIGSCQWVCFCPVAPPVVNLNSCGCNINSNRSRPSGKIILKDTQLGDKGVRRVKVRSTKYRWGFLWSSTDTDDEGCWQIARSYNVKRAKVQVVFKDRVSDRAVIRSFRGVRAWNAFLEAVDFTWYLTRDNKEWNDLCLRIEDDTDNTSLKEQTFVAATTNNGIHEFYDDHSSLPSPGRTSFLIHTLGDQLNAAPMFRKMDQEVLSISDALEYVLAYQTAITGILYTYWEVAKPDVFISFGDGDKSDRKKETVYHEMAHVSQYSRFGRQWWRQYVLYIGRVWLAGDEDLYGDGSRAGAGRAELAEGLAYSIGNFMAGEQYGASHSLTFNFSDNAWSIFAENKTFHLSRTSFIPRGLFYDLLDSPTLPANIPVGFEPSSITDQVSGISFEEQYNLLNPSVVEISDFKAQLLQNNSSANSNTNLENLFFSYGH